MSNYLHKNYNVKISNDKLAFIKREQDDDDDIVFIEEVKTTTISNEDNKSTLKSTIATTTTATKTSTVDNQDIDMADSNLNEFKFTYTQDDEDIAFDSDDELISVFNMHRISQEYETNNLNNNDKINENDSNLKKENIENNKNKPHEYGNEDEDEEDDDIKFILDKNNAFFSKIDSILIDLTTDNDSPTDKSKSKTTSSDLIKQTQITSPIVIKEEKKETKLTQIKLDFKPVAKSITKTEQIIEEKNESIIEDTSSNDALLCQIANDYERQHQTQQQPQPQQLTSSTPKLESNTKLNNSIFKFKEVRIERIEIDSKLPKKISPESTTKRNIINLKRLRELETSSSDDEATIKRVENVTSKKPKSILSSSSSSEDDLPNLESPKTNEFNKIPTKSPLLQSNKTSSLFENNYSIATGENLLGRTLKVMDAPVSMKSKPTRIALPFTRASSSDTSPKVTSKLTANNKPISSSTLSDMSPNETEENQQPQLNPVDLKKKQALDKLTRMSSLVQPITKKSKAFEDLKKMNFKEKSLVLNSLPKNKQQTVSLSNELSLTQQCNLGKLENMARLQKVLAAKQAEAKTVETTNLSTETTHNVRQAQHFSISDNKVEQSRPKLNEQPKPVVKEKIKSDNTVITHNVTTSDKKKKPKPVEKNDIVGSIISNMNKQNATNLQQPVNNNAKENKTKTSSNYCCENFILRILSWKYVWLVEQEKFTQQKNFNVKRMQPPPIVSNEELMPIVDKYVNYDEYHRAIFPFLLLETWEEISRAFKDNLMNKKEKTYSNIPIWLKCIEKSEQFNDMSILKCQTIIEDNQQKANFEDDILRLNLILVDPNDKTKTVQSNCLAIIYKANKLREGDAKIMDPVKECARSMESKLKQSSYTEDSPVKIQSNKSSKKNFCIYEFCIYIKNRRYLNKPYLEIDYEYFTNLSSSLRRIRALISFKNSSILKTVISPSIDNPVYHIAQNEKYINNGQKFSLPNINEYNDSQKEVILEASSIVNSNESKLYFIQGPPGTGKTFTIVGIIKAMLYRATLNKKLDKPPLSNNPKVIKKNACKLLICSPSNAGCDEIARRLKEHKDLVIVRVGVSENIHPDCQQFSLSVLAKKKYQDLLNKEQCKKSSSLKEQDETFRSREMLFRKRLRELKSAAVPNTAYIKNTEDMLVELLKRKSDFEDALRKSNSKDNLSIADKKKFDAIAKEKVLREADIIICTLNYSGNSILDCLTMEKNHGVSLVDVVIIDEAAQCLEVDFLIPMRFQCTRVIQVGDPEQLPATVCSQRAQDFKFQKSFFERIYYNFFFEEKNPIKMLYIQYRMHPEICIFPSFNFYKKRLITHKETIESRKKFNLEPYLIFDLPNSKEKGEDDTNSIYNPYEAQQVVEFSKTLRASFKTLSIGIIAPYQKQVQYVASLINENNLDRVEVGTVDSFQGREKDIILLSSVRANSNNTIGFVSNKQRLNVSLTRAKHALYIFCNIKTLMCNTDWSECIKDATKRNLIRTIQNRSGSSS